MGSPHRAAENCADRVDSTHKTLLFIYGSAILNICTESLGLARAPMPRSRSDTQVPRSIKISEWTATISSRTDADIKYFYQEAAQIAGLGSIAST